MSTITEILDGTRAGKINASGGSKTLQRHFMVAGGEDPLDIHQAIIDMDAEIKPGSATYDVGTHVVDGYTKTATLTYYGTKSWSILDGQSNTWEFVLEYTNASDGGGGDIEWIATQGDTRATTKAVYRTGANPPTDSPSPSEDIGGTKVDAGGTPTTITWVDWRFSTAIKSWSFPWLDAYSDLVGKRNESTYEGGAIGTVLYLGFSWGFDTSNELWTITHEFAVDKKTFHAEQVARTTPDGDSSVSTGGGEEETYHANHVYWVQPFAKADFSILPDF